MILLTDEELKEQDANLRAGILAHHALAVKNGRDPTLGTSEALFERRKVAKAQLKKVGEWGNRWCTDHHNIPPHLKRKECPTCWQALLEETE